jgi:hypothetical protein
VYPISVLPIEISLYFSWKDITLSFLGALVRSASSRSMESMKSCVKKLPHSLLLLLSGESYYS